MEQINYEITFAIEQVHWWFRVRRELAIQLLYRYAPKAKKVLDIGCAGGALLLDLKKCGIEAVGADSSATALDECRRRGIESVTHGSVTRLPFDDNSFDAVFLLDVIEHVSDEDLAFREIYRILKPEGILILFTSAFKFLWSKQDEMSHHYRRYTIGELKVLGERYFTILYSSYFNFFLFFPILFTRLIMNTFRVINIAEGHINSPFLNRMMFTIFRSELPLLRWVRFPFGVSIAMVVKKQGSI